MKIKQFALSLCISFLVAIPPAAISSAEAHTAPVVPEDKPILHYLFRSEALLEELAVRTGIDDETLLEVERCARIEGEAVRTLYQASRIVVSQESFTLSEKRAILEAIGFNETVEGLTRASWDQLREVLDTGEFSRFREYVESAWSAEKEIHSKVTSRRDSRSVTYNVFATQYHGETDYEVAIPDKYIKFANREWEQHPGYPGSNYRVDLRRGGYSVSRVLVWDVGPWNIDDNYWNAPVHPERPRRLFTDLPTGMPESQAAYFDGYHGGTDQYGRTVVNPSAVDLTPSVAADLGLVYLQNDWIDVTFTWEPDFWQCSVGPTNAGPGILSWFFVAGLFLTPVSALIWRLRKRERAKPAVAIGLALVFLLAGQSAVEAQVLKEMDVLAEIDVPLSAPGPIAWCDGALFCLDSGAKTIFRVEADGSAQEIFGLGNRVASPGDLMCFGGNLWVSDRSSGEIAKYSPGGKWLNSIKAPGSEPSGIAFDGTRVWISTRELEIYKAALAGSELNVIERFKKKKIALNALAWAQDSKKGTLWGCRAGKDEICRIDPRSGKIIKRLVSPAADPVGIAWDGSALWVADGHAGKLFKVSPP